MTSQIDALVTDLARVRDNDITSEPDTPGAQTLLAAITAEHPAPPRRLLSRRPLTALVAAAALATTIVIGVGAQDSGPLRSYANAAVSIHKKGAEYEVEVKDAYADQREFSEAFAKFGLDVRLSIVPVKPGNEREVIRIGSLHAPKDGTPPHGRTATFSAVLKCPPGQDACPLKVRLGGDAFPQEGADIVIGRKAAPGEVYSDAYPASGDNPKNLRLTGRTVAQALADLHRRGLTATFTLGTFNPDGSGSSWDPPKTWRPAPDRRITGAWPSSSSSVGLLIHPQKTDPQPHLTD